MAPRRARRDRQKAGRQASVPSQPGKQQPQDVEKEQRQLPPCKSKQQEEIRHHQEHTAIASGNEVPQNPSEPQQDQDQYQKRKRAPDQNEIPTSAPAKRLRTRQQAVGAGSPAKNELCQPLSKGVAENNICPIAYWVKKKTWPKELFEQDDQTRKDFDKDSWFEKYWVPEMSMKHVLARKKSSSSLRSKRSEVGSDVPSTKTSTDQKPREVQSSLYQDVRYKTILETEGSFMFESKLGISDASKSFCQTILENEQTVPQESLFRDDRFRKTCEKIQDRNEAKVVQDISRLIVPSVDALTSSGAEHLEILVESVDEGWMNSIPITKPRPQPDYAVGFSRGAFTEDQLKRLKPFVGDLFDTSFFMATFYMYFPFLTCEVKCGASALDVADRQNSHSMTLAVRGVVELFRLLKREKELHREILAFSFSHDHSAVRIYGHYPEIDGIKTTFYRYPIYQFSFTTLDGREKWTAYKITKNIYDIWMPFHLKRICSVIDNLAPDIDFDVSSRQSELTGSGLPQGLEGHHLHDHSSRDAASLLEETRSPSSRLSSGDVTPGTSLSQRIDGRASKKLKKGAQPD